MKFDDLRTALERDRAEQREARRQRRIREGGPEWTADDLTIGELKAALQERLAAG